MNRRLIGFGFGGAAAAAIALTTAIADQPAGDKAAPSAGKVIGLAVTSDPFALYKGADDCLDGPARAAKELERASVPAAERKRLLLPESLKELEQKAFHTPDGRDLCAVPDYPRPPMHTAQGKISYGLDLDGTKDGGATDTTCAHQKFQGADGGLVDNQTYRLIGCLSNYRGPPGENGYLESLRNSGLKDGGTTILFEIMGVKDAKNDSDVQVGIYNGASPMVVDPSGAKMLPYASLTMPPDKRYQAVAHGRIADGVLTTDPTDVHLHYDFGGYQREYHIKGARLRLKLAEDGSAKGLLAGYLDMADVDMTQGTKQAAAEMVKYDCPSLIQAIHRLADGYKDPKTGQCTALSTAFQIEAIPAFVIHPEDAKRTASADEAGKH